MTEKEFRERVLPLRKLMYGIGLRIGLSPDDAADAVQETQVRLWQSRASIPSDPPHLKPYCLAAFKNECISLLRRARPKVPIDESPEIMAPDTDPVEYADTRQNIRRLIESLPEGQRQAVSLSSFGGMDNKEIAEAMGESDANVRQLLSRGRRRLRQLFNKNL